MSHFDVFNGDADGICALHQLRLADPRESTLVTGVKRDIELLGRVPAQAGDSVTALDISLDRNRAALTRLLERGVHVEYFDHHFAGTVPEHPNLRAHIDVAPQVCTSVLVDRHLQGRQRLWAVVAAFGDNLVATARSLAAACGLAEHEAARLCELGESINYNAYGFTESELFMAPVELYRAMRPYANPFEFIARDPAPALLADGRRRDLALAQGRGPAFTPPGGRIWLLPDAGWAHRVQGAFANQLATQSPHLAHAVLCEHGDHFIASIRAPVDRPQGADTLCRRFPGGGGRAAAAGIDELPRERLQEFVDAFGTTFGGQAGEGGGHGHDAA